MWKIGNVEISNQIIIAPMAGVTNYSFRKLAFELGAGMVCNEMVSDKALEFNNKKTIDMTKKYPGEGIVSMQIFGRDVDSLVNAAIFLDTKSNCDIIDINFGCPVKKIALSSKAGSALLREPEKIKEIIQAIVPKISKPLTIKIRSGWDDKSINAVDIAKMAEAEGVKAIAIHGRTRAQMYQGNANWDIIKEVKEAVSIPVIGNGDVFTPEDAKRMLEYTGCDAVMLARGARRNPWLIKQALDFITKGNYELIDFDSTWELVLKHAQYLYDLKGEQGVVEMRTHIAQLLKGKPDSKEIKRNLSELSTLEDVRDLVAKYRGK